MAVSHKPSKSKAKVVRDVSAADLAEELGLHEQTIYGHVKRGAPHGRDKRRRYVFNVAEYRAWMKAQKLTGEPHRPTHAKDSPSLEKARLRKENALAAKYELQVSRERRDLLPAAEVRAWATQAFVAVRNRMLGLGAAVAPLMEGRDAAERQGIVDEQVTLYLHELADAFERGLGGDQAAAAGDADGVGGGAPHPAAQGVG